MIRYDLQFFAKEGMGGEKTEPATSKKLNDARKEGQVAKSREIANGLGLLTLFLILKFWVGNMGIQMMDVFGTVYNRIPEVTTYWHDNMPEQEAGILFRHLMFQVLIIVAPILLIGMLVAFVCDLETDHEAAEAQAEQAESSEGLQEVLLAKRVGRTCQVHCQDRFDIIYMLRLSQGSMAAAFESL